MTCYHSRAWHKLIAEFIFLIFVLPLAFPMAFPTSIQPVTGELAPRDHFMPTFLLARDGPGKVTGGNRTAEMEP